MKEDHLWVLAQLMVSYLLLSSSFFVSRCKCSISSRNLSSNNQQSPTTSSSCSHEPNTQTHQELVALPIFVFGEQTPPSISSIALPQLSSSESSSSFVFPDGDCAICLDDYVHGESIRVLPRCKHMFHKDCIDHWLSSRTSSCPICRAKSQTTMWSPQGQILLMWWQMLQDHLHYFLSAMAGYKTTCEEFRICLITKNSWQEIRPELRGRRCKNAYHFSLRLVDYYQTFLSLIGCE